MTSPEHTKLVVIGGGPGGYAAAFLAADLGMETTLVDLEPNPGGVCLYRGCIPSKALLHAAKILSEARDAKEIGIDFGEPKIHIDQVRTWKNKVVSQMTGGLGVLSKQRKIKFIQGRATFLSSESIHIKKTDGTEITLTFDNAILATGSHPITLPFAPTSPRILDSTTALNLEDIPAKLLVLGGGYIGLELGTVYSELGSKVSIVEMLPSLLAGVDRDLGVILENRIKKHFSAVKVNTKVTKMEETTSGIKVTFEDKEGNISSEEYDKVLVAIGRKPNSKNLGLEKTKVTLTDRGFVQVNGQRQTTDPKIYAIGDIAGDPMLAHKASHEGRVAVEAIAGHKVAFEPQAIPAVVFTDPEIAWCGLTETEAAAKGREVMVVKFPWAASGRAVTLNRTDGLTKMIIDPTTERILGMAICGVGAGEMISEGVLAVEMGAIVSDLKLSIHPHPTLSETVMESAESFFGLSTHIYRPKKA
ncbi:MAG: dihydrolipoyl dehydrogenase [Candidatus Omnitrophica bacterium]|nr:dihydrolipoyl dehydrogenase [Candidatus Omnitrophota bacterium]